MSTSYSIGLSRTYSHAPEEMVQRIIQKEQEQDLEETREMESEDNTFSDWIKLDEDYWKNRSLQYLKNERWILNNNDKIPSWEVAGSLHYGMSLSQMQAAINQKFCKLASSSYMITEESLAQNHNRSNLYPETGRGSDNITRIWGAKFLKTNLNDSHLKAVDHFLVVDPGTTEIEVEVRLDGDYPYLATVKHAHILAQKIEGDKKAWDYRNSSCLEKVGYKDFKDIGNIILDENRIAWIVDTELKSFAPPQLTPNLTLIQNYLKKRFAVLNSHIYSHIFKISMSDIGVK